MSWPAEHSSSLLAWIGPVAKRLEIRDAALRGLTQEPAELLGVGDRVGSLEAGKDANLLFPDEPPAGTEDDGLRYDLANGVVVSQQELFRRMCFNALISNTDDHPRNHAAIAMAQEWGLSPAYDLTPAMPVSLERRDLAMQCGDIGRYAHAESYVRLCGEAAGLQVVDAKPMPIRHEGGEAIPGRLFLMQRTPSSRAA